LLLTDTRRVEPAGGTFCFKIRVVEERFLTIMQWMRGKQTKKKREILKFMLSFQPGVERQELEVQENLVAPRIELVRLRIECGIVMHRSEVREYHPSFGYY